MQDANAARAIAIYRRCVHEVGALRSLFSPYAISEAPHTGFPRRGRAGAVISLP